jgi:hypothetical protein
MNDRESVGLRREQVDGSGDCRSREAGVVRGHRQPEEAAILVAFRASDEAAFIWGSLIDNSGAQAIALISQRLLSVAKLSSVFEDCTSDHGAPGSSQHHADDG